MVQEFMLPLNLIYAEEEIIKKVKDSQGKLLLTYFNQHCFNIYQYDIKYQSVINNIFSVYIDGIGMYYASKLLNKNVKKKFNASDLNEKLFEYFKSTKERVFIIGGNFTNDKIQLLINNKLNICGYKNGYFNLDEEKEIIDNIKSAEPDIVIIGMGIPKQEIFASKLNEKLSGKKIICVGNFLEFYLGTVKRVPKFLRNSGLEWLFRLITEPARLWQRYMLGIPLFIFSIIKIKLNLFKN
jgi:N-acetylglucosaminyldiphosphoundecaprenol N-acetyl-beta-D-mannosaminyltransferase